MVDPLDLLRHPDPLILGLPLLDRLYPQSLVSTVNSQKKAVLKRLIFKISKLHQPDLYVKSGRCPVCKQIITGCLPQAVAGWLKQCKSCSKSWNDRQLLDKKYEQCQTYQVFSQGESSSPPKKIIVDKQYINKFKEHQELDTIFVHFVSIVGCKLAENLFSQVTLQQNLLLVQAQPLQKPSHFAGCHLKRQFPSPNLNLIQQYDILYDIIQQDWRGQLGPGCYFPFKIAMAILISACKKSQATCHIKIISEDCQFIRHLVRNQLRNHQLPSDFPTIHSNQQKILSRYGIVLSTPLQKSKSDFSNFSAIVDISHEDNYNSRQLVNSIDPVVDFILENCTIKTQLQKDRGRTAPKRQPDILFKLTDTQPAFKRIDQDPLKMLSQYYVRSRMHKKITNKDFQLTIAVANSISHFRMLKGWGDGSLQMIDAVVSILLDQQTTRNKYGSQHLLFGHQFTKFIGHNWSQRQLQCLQYSYRTQDLREKRVERSRSEQFRQLLGLLEELIRREQE